VSAPAPNYAHKATFVAPHDGDSFWLRVDFGKLTHGITLDPLFYIRLAGIDCWELSQPLGPKARDFSTNMLSKEPIVVQTVKPDLSNLGLEKYGRLLCNVWVGDDLLSDLLRIAGYEKTSQP